MQIAGNNAETTNFYMEFLEAKPKKRKELVETKSSSLPKEEQQFVNFVTKGQKIILEYSDDVMYTLLNMGIESNNYLILLATLFRFVGPANAFKVLILLETFKFDENTIFIACLFV